MTLTRPTLWSQSTEARVSLVLVAAFAILPWSAVRVTQTSTRIDAVTWPFAALFTHPPTGQTKLYTLQELQQAAFIPGHATSYPVWFVASALFLFLSMYTLLWVSFEDARVISLSTIVGAVLFVASTGYLWAVYQYNAAPTGVSAIPLSVTVVAPTTLLLLLNSPPSERSNG